MAQSKMLSDAEFYKAHFDSRGYINTYYSEPQAPSGENSFVPFILRSLSKTFSAGQYKGKRLIDVGSGPTIHAVVSACHYYEELLLSDFLDNNRAELNKWLQNEDGCLNWKPFFEYICKMEGRSPSDVEAKLRQKVKVLKCDVLLENPFHPQIIEPADCVISSFCLEAACLDMQSYREALGRVTKMLSPPGILVMVGGLGETFYDVENTRFTSLTLDIKEIQRILNDLGLTIQELNIHQPNEGEKVTLADYEAVFYLVASKSAKSA